MRSIIFAGMIAGAAVLATPAQAQYYYYDHHHHHHDHDGVAIAVVSGVIGAAVGYGLAGGYHGHYGYTGQNYYPRYGYGYGYAPEPITGVGTTAAIEITAHELIKGVGFPKGRGGGSVAQQDRAAVS
jgi:hypothetical protein